MASLPPLTGNPAILRAIRLIGSEQRLAAALGIGRSTLYRYRLGKHEMPYRIALRFEEVTQKRVRRASLFAKEG